MHIFTNIFSFIKRHKIISIICTIVIAILIFIFRPKPAPLIATQKIARENLTQVVSVSGAVAAKSSANLSFPIGGTISWVGVKQGDTVVAGQTVATLDSRTALKNLQSSLIAYSIARNTFDQTAQNNGGINQQAALNAASNDTIKRILLNNQNNLDQAVNSVELSDLARQQSMLNTPISGIVSTANVTSSGTTAIPGATLFTIVDPTSVVFNMDVDEADIGKIGVGQKVSLTLDAYPNDTITLPVDNIDFVSHTTTNGGNAYTVAVKLGANANYRYRIGMNGNADITTAERFNVLTVPLASIVNNNQVYVKTSKGFALKTISLGLQSDTQAEVTAGLSAGDTIALDPVQVTKK